MAKPIVHRIFEDKQPLDPVQIYINGYHLNSEVLKAKYITDEYIIFKFDSDIEKATLLYDLKAKETYYLGDPYDLYCVFDDHLFALNMQAEYLASDHSDMLHIIDLKTGEDKAYPFRSNYLKPRSLDNQLGFYSQDNVDNISIHHSHLN